MAEYDGLESIGFLLGGGAKQMKQQAFDEGRLNTAKTEGALASARESQLKAQAAANKMREAEKFEEVAIANGMPATQAALIGNLIRSEGGADFSAGMTGLGEQQEQGFRTTLADVAAPAEARLRAGQAIQGKVQGDFAPIGTHGVVDLTQDDQELLKGPGSGTTQQRNFEYMEELPDAGSKERFGRVLRADQIVDAGGGVKVRQPTAGGGVAPVVDPATVADNEANRAGARKLGVTVAAQKADYPMVRYTLEQNKLSLGEQNKIIDELINDEKLWQAVGPTQLVSKIAGTEGAYIRGKLDTLGNKVMLSTLINLRAMSKTGGAVGNVSDKEGDTMRGAQAAITNFNLMAGDMRKELIRLRAYNSEFEGIMDRAFAATYDDQGNPILSMAPRGAPGADGGGGGETIEEIIINNGDGEYDENGDLVDARGWIFMKDAAGNAAWVSPDGSEYEEVAQ